MRRIRSHLTYANVMVTLLAFVVLAGGAAYAANTVFSSDIVDGQVKTPDLANTAVTTDKLAGGSVGTEKVRNDNLTGGDVAPNTLKGADIDESTLSNVGGGGAAGGDLTGTYPNPLIRANAVGGGKVANDSLSGADIAESTLLNVDAGTVGGLQVRKINFQVPFGTGPTTVLDLAGLQITADCQNFGDVLDVKAFTSKNGATIFYIGSSVVFANDIDEFRSIDSAQLSNGFFDIGDQLQIDNATPGDGNDAFGTLHYSAPDGSVVVAHLAFDEVPVGGGSCALTGTASGG